MCALAARRRLVLDVRQVDGDATGALLGCAVDLLEAPGATTVQRAHDLGQRSGERGLAVIDVANWFRR